MYYRYIIFIFTLLLASCQTDDDHFSNGQFPWKIDHVSSIGSFHYENDELIKIGNEEFTYTDGQLSTIRNYSADTSIRHRVDNGQVIGKDTIINISLLKYEFLRISDQQQLKNLDTFYLSKSKNEILQSELILLNNSLSSTSYDNNRIMSIKNNHFFDDDLVERTFEYNSDGNLIRKHEIFDRIHGWQPTLPRLADEIITEYSDFDDNFNPYSALSDEVFFNSSNAFFINKSKNNYRKEKISILYFETWIDLEVDYSYEYNEDNLPTKITKLTNPYPKSITILYE